ncbi:hypothetical protein B0H13DRAFT_2674337 [Mycena leptocephala]|nr:hypothetical protein B0H13DRAFT_2674337 [Mycena leptocephala]
MDPAVSLNLNTTLGAFQIGVLVSYVLFGVTTTQTYIYYSRFPDDSLKLKVLVAFVWICEVGHALCIGHSLYVYTISDYAHPERVLGPAPKSLETTSIFSGVIGACVQGFFSFRIYVISKKLYIPFLSWVMSVLRLLGCIALFVAGLGMKSVNGYVLQWEWLATFVWSVSTTNDLMISATLVVLLRNHRNRVHMRTAALVEKLILWSIETGILTSATSIATLVCFVAMKDNFIWIAFWVIGARGEGVSHNMALSCNFNHISLKVFSNSLLASLNSRATLRALNVPISLSSLTPADNRGNTIDIFETPPGEIKSSLLTLVSSRPPNVRRCMAYTIDAPQDSLAPESPPASVAAARLWLARLRLDRLRLAAAWKPSNLDGFG